MTRPDLTSEALRAFWRERHLCTLSTVRADGTPHVVAVGVTFDADTGHAYVITSGDSRKVAHVRAAGARHGGAGAAVAVCQVDGRRWSTLEGRATVRDDAESVALAERRYAQRYREPRANPRRVVIEIEVTRVLGNTANTGIAGTAGTAGTAGIAGT